MDAFVVLASWLASDAMRHKPSLSVLGINRTQDGSICLVRDNHIALAIAKERLTRRKHDWGALGDIANIYVPLLPSLLEWPIDVIVECYSTQQPTAAEKDAYRRELHKSLRLSASVQFIEISHHYAHLYSAFDPSEFTDAAAMVIDAQGSHLTDLKDGWVFDKRDAALRETMSFYSCQGGLRRCIGKQSWDGNLPTVAGLGMFYNLLTRTMFTGEANEGKLMGLASFGSHNRVQMPSLHVDGYKAYFPEKWKSVLVQAPICYKVHGGKDEFVRAADFAAAGQKTFEDAIVSVACWLHKTTKLENLCFAGGTALNCSANTRLMTDTPFKRLFIPPAPHDGGTALGCALFGVEKITGQRSTITWRTDYLGPEIDYDLSVIPSPVTMAIERPADLWTRVADLLVEGLTIGVACGRSEFGPRALGNRSILADPRRPGMKDHVNRNIKGREWFRPLAPVVPLDEVNMYFELEGPCPFMQWTAVVRPEYREKLPAIVHHDGTARLQTVTEDQNPLLYRLLKLFRARTGFGVLMNTSFNGKDEPIVESADDAMRCLTSTELDAIALPNMLVRKQQVAARPGLELPVSAQACR